MEAKYTIQTSLIHSAIKTVIQGILLFKSHPVHNTILQTYKTYHASSMHPTSLKTMYAILALKTASFNIVHRVEIFKVTAGVNIFLDNL